MSQIIVELKPFATGVMTAFTLFTLLSALIYGLTILRLIQRYDVLSYINVAIPLNLELFLEYFAKDIFDLIPSVIPRIPNETLCVVHQKLDENDVDCYITNSGGHLLTPVISYILIKLIIVGSLKFLRKKSSSKEIQKIDTMSLGIGSVKIFNIDKTQKSQSKKGCREKTRSLITETNKTLNLVFLVNLLIGIQTDILLPTFSNLRNLQFKGATIFVSSIMTLMIVASYLVLLSLMTYKLLKIHQINKQKGDLNKAVRRVKSRFPDHLTRWEFMVEDLKPNTGRIAFLINHYTYFRDFLMSFFVIIFIEHPLIQLVPSILMVIWVLFVLLRYKPYKKSQ